MEYRSHPWMHACDSRVVTVVRYWRLPCGAVLGPVRSLGNLSIRPAASRLALAADWQWTVVAQGGRGMSGAASS
jgi:hypothetical protein